MLNGTQFIQKYDSYFKKNQVANLKINEYNAKEKLREL